MTDNRAENGDEKRRNVLSGVVIPAPRPPSKKPRRIRLTTARDIRKELAYLYREMLENRIDTDQARTGGFLLRTMLESIRTDELDQRLTLLEKQQNE